jgi:hypothetical protein
MYDGQTATGAIEEEPPDLVLVLLDLRFHHFVLILRYYPK